MLLVTTSNLHAMPPMGFVCVDHGLSCATFRARNGIPPRLHVITTDHCWHLVADSQLDNGLRIFLGYMFSLEEQITVSVIFF